jgi:hypothetical protein
MTGEDEIAGRVSCPLLLTFASFTRGWWCWEHNEEEFIVWRLMKKAKNNYL